MTHRFNPISGKLELVSPDLTGVITGNLTGSTTLTVNGTNSAQLSGWLSDKPPVANLKTVIEALATLGFVVNNSENLNSGWIDITPTYLKDDGTGGWSYTVITGSRKELTAVGTGATVSTLFFKYHIPHEILLNQAAGEIFIHPHIELTSIAAGNIYLQGFISAGLRDGAMSAEFPVTWTITPSGKTPFVQYVSPYEIAIPSGLAAYLVPDAIWTLRLVRDAGNALDTYAGVVALHTVDLHVKADFRPTTSKDVGTGWVKSIITA